LDLKGRILAVDPGDKRIGIAVSDPTGTIANPLTVIKHISRVIDAGVIAQIVSEYQVVRIIVGQAIDDDGNLGVQARKAQRLADAICLQTSIPLEMWDESGSTNEARSARIALNSSRKKRKGHLDELAATVILQSYLDAHIG
jgi:putative holliday junction resolvase